MVEEGTTPLVVVVVDDATPLVVVVGWREVPRVVLVEALREAEGAEVPQAVRPTPRTTSNKVEERSLVTSIDYLSSQWSRAFAHSPQVSSNRESAAIVDSGDGGVAFDLRSFCGDMCRRSFLGTALAGNRRFCRGFGVSKWLVWVNWRSNENTPRRRWTKGTTSSEMGCGGFESNSSERSSSHFAPTPSDVWGESVQNALLRSIYKPPPSYGASP